MCKYPYTETVQSPNRLVHYALVFRTPATRRNPTNKIEITLKIEQAVLYLGNSEFEVQILKNSSRGKHIETVKLTQRFFCYLTLRFICM